MIQLIFDKNLESPEFIDIFRSDDSYQPALDNKLAATQKIVEEKVGFFAQVHSEYQTTKMQHIVEDYLIDLKEKEDLNGGFPDTESMRIALFGQVAFKYEQECQEIYKTIKTKIIEDTIKEVNKMLDEMV